MSAKFEGQVVLVTGASAGIGLAMAREFARQGARLVLCARRTDRLEALAAELGGPSRAIAVACDVTHDGDVERAVDEARRAFGRLDVCVANAGYAVGGKLERLTIEDYRRQLETNLFGVLRAIYASLDEIKRSRGRIVVVGSVVAYASIGGHSAYSTSKSALLGLTRSLGHEMREHGVSVTHILPGFVESEITFVNNQGRFDPNTRNLAPPRMLVVSPERAAREIVRAVAARKGEAVITGHGRWIVRLQRHFPQVFEAIVRRLKVTARTKGT